VTEFRVKAGWPDGSVAEQSVMAVDIGAARLEVERRGGHVFEVRRRGLSLGRGGSRRRGRVKMADFLIFNQELIALLKAGLPVVRSFEILLKAGEKSGEIEAVLRRYLKYQKTVIAMTRKVVSTMVYPVILIALSIALITILMTYVIRRFTEFFADFDAELPLLTVVVLGIATFLRKNFLLLASGLGVGGFLLYRWFQTSTGRIWLDGALLKMPVVGGIFQRFAITQFTRSLGTLLGGGTPLVPALENAADAIGNRSVSRKVASVVPRVREGRELWKALEATGIFTDLTIEMIKVGESSGALEEMLAAVSEFYDEEIDLRLARVISFVEPAILVLMGGVIVTILLSVYLPMFRLMSAIKT
jgi:type IV pilus assembly protein PilC